ncbi:hypothetical protein [Williamsia sterculiae]|uniref:Asp23 family, cell envelope-related function n=1 Tax=Williamsia sterculiae TaxID=1344003 RepID=A0A1N7HCG4_9NOCA|nr:hypothetical protein [Williamsia sterculiae]SIS22453.1 hypothetical protein SAMN05445060_3953 [Williamsia sterculiae]
MNAAADLPVASPPDTTSHVRSGPDGDGRGATADALVAAVTSVPGVTGLSGGRFGEVATYLTGRRVAGVRFDEDGGEVHIVVDLHRSVLTTAEAVRTAAEQALGKPVTVVVEDIDAPAG